MESNQLCAETLTHYSTEMLTNGSDYDPLHLLIAITDDVPPNPGPPSKYPCSVCFMNVTSHCTSYLRKMGTFEMFRYLKRCRWLDLYRPPSPSRTANMLDTAFNILQWKANGNGNKQTELNIFLEAHYVKVALIQESKFTSQSRGPELHPITTGSTQRPRRRFTVFHSQISQLVNFTRQPHSIAVKSDPILKSGPSASLWIIQSCSTPTCTFPGQLLQW